MTPKLAPEQEARVQIDAKLEDAGWVVQDYRAMNLSASRGVAVREYPMKRGHGTADYLLFVDRRPVGVLEAKRDEVALSGVEGQAQRYSDGLPDKLMAPIRPLPFVYVSTGIKMGFYNRLDPHPRTRPVFAPHRPETLAEWLRASLYRWARPTKQEGDPTAALSRADDEPRHSTPANVSTLRRRLREGMPSVDAIPDLWPNQLRAIANLERSLAEDKPRALIQMATGSGKSKMAVAAAYRLTKFAQARRILFLVDRTNLGEQMENELHAYVAYDDNKRFPELYAVQRLTSNHVRDSSKIVISTIQRLYAMLRGEELPPEAEDASRFDDGDDDGHAVDVEYNPAVPPELFDFIVVDECHRSIYTKWRNVLLYFDAYLIGLTATPSNQTWGFFRQNLVMEYGPEQAVADGVNVDYDIYRIRTKITEQGSTIEAGPGVMIGRRNRLTRAERWQRPDTDLSYEGQQLDYEVVSRGQIQLIMQTFKDRLFTEIFPGRTKVPKTVIFAKDDSHAEDIVEVIREVFGLGNDFCQKITYKVTGRKPQDVLQDFRIRHDPRIAVTVDMIATGTDVQPIEIVMFMRPVRSRQLYEQMRGRGVRVIKDDVLRRVSSDARAKTHFMVVDCVGVTETPLQDRPPLDRKRTVSLEALLTNVAQDVVDADVIATLVSRLTRLAKRCTSEEHGRIAALTGGKGLRELAQGLARSLDPDAQVDAARQRFGLAPGVEPTDAQVEDAGRALILAAAAPLANRPELRALLTELRLRVEQIIDEVSRDDLIHAGGTDRSHERAEALVAAFEKYLGERPEEVARLVTRPGCDDVETFDAAVGAYPRRWTPERLWDAYGLVASSKVHGEAQGRGIADWVALVRFAAKRDEQLVPWRDRVRERFERWMSGQRERFSAEQVRWLEMMRDHAAGSVRMDVEDFDLVPFVGEGGLGKAGEVFGGELGAVLRELGEVLGG